MNISSWYTALLYYLNTISATYLAKMNEKKTEPHNLCPFSRHLHLRQIPGLLPTRGYSKAIEHCIQLCKFLLGDFLPHGLIFLASGFLQHQRSIIPRKIWTRNDICLERFGLSFASNSSCNIKFCSQYLSNIPVAWCFIVAEYKPPKKITWFAVTRLWPVVPTLSVTSNPPREPSFNWAISRWHALSIEGRPMINVSVIVPTCSPSCW